MKQKIAAIFENAHPGEIRMVSDYSGRGMYGKTTTGVACDSWNDVLFAIGIIIEQDRLDTTSERNEFADALQGGFYHDQFGKGIIIY